MKKNKGFTLIELLVVIAIIGLLSTLAIVALDSARQKSRDSKRVTDIRQTQTALELYYNDNDSYPTNGSTIDLGATANPIKDCEALPTQDCTCLDSDGFVGVASCSDAGTDVIYMGQISGNPLPGGATYIYNPIDDASTCGVVGQCESYELSFTLEGSVDNLASGSHIASPAGIQ